MDLGSGGSGDGPWPGYLGLYRQGSGGREHSGLDKHGSMLSPVPGMRSWSSGDPEPGWLPSLPLSPLTSSLLVVSQSDPFLCPAHEFPRTAGTRTTNWVA